MRFEAAARRKLRRLGKTQRDLAQALHYAPTYICDVLCGRGSEAARLDVIRMLRQWEKEQAQERRRAAE